MLDGRPLIDFVLERLPDRACRFVFPSAVAARARAREAALASGGPVDAERFLAWDDFKAATLAAERIGLVPANSAARSIFSASLLAENARAAAAGKPLFRELVDPDHARDYAPFVASLARTLPALDGVLRRAAGADGAGTAAAGGSSVAAADPYFADLAAARSRYAAFLEQNALFEPAWDRVPFRRGPSSWVLFLPELAEDWDQYEDELSRAAGVEIVPLAALAPPAPDPASASVAGGAAGRLVEFPDADAELRWVAGAIRRLLDSGACESRDVAVTVPRLSDYEGRLLEAFRVRDVPADLRAGKSILDHPAGRLFAALAACPSTRWSFRALKDLLLDAAFPWKDPGAASALIEFGLRYRCVSGYPEDGAEVDVWERSFERFRGREDEIRLPVAMIAAFYRKLKRDVRAVVGAKTFAALRESLLMFKTNHFDESRLDPASDALFARALVELSDLSATELRLRGTTVEDPYGLFRTHLRGVSYVYQGAASGVAVYDYRVSAGISPKVHFVLNATQDALTVRADPAPFLREDRKLLARLGDRDLSGAFVEAYALSGGAVVFTSAARSFSGPAQPHRALSDERFKAGPDARAFGEGYDPLAVEAGLLSGAPGVRAEDGPPPSAAQRAGLEAWTARSAGAQPLDLRRDPAGDPALAAALRTKLSKAADPDGRGPRVSPTDLSEFLACPFSWLLRRGLSVRERDAEIATVDQRDLGILYHRILERFFKAVAADGPRFRAERLDSYKALLDAEIDAALAEAAAGEGAFQESVYAMLRNRIGAALRAYLDADASRLDGRAVVGAELPLRKDYSDLAVALSGVCDLALRADDGSLEIVDFKTGRMPRAADLAPDETGALGDLQAACYAAMAEARGDGEKVAAARFYSIDDREFRVVLDEAGAEARKRGPLPLSRDEFEPCLAAVDEAVQAAAGALEGGAYPVPPPRDRSACPACRVQAVCRIRFAGGDA